MQLSAGQGKFAGRKPTFYLCVMLLRVTRNQSSQTSHSISAGKNTGLLHPFGLSASICRPLCISFDKALLSSINTQRVHSYLQHQKSRCTNRSLTSCSSFMRSNMFSMSMNACWITLTRATHSTSELLHMFIQHLLDD